MKRKNLWVYWNLHSVGWIDGCFQIRQIDFVDKISNFLKPLFLSLFSTNPDIIFINHIVTEQVLKFKFILHLIKMSFNLLFFLFKHYQFLLHLWQAFVGLTSLELVLQWFRQVEKSFLDKDWKTKKFKVSICIALTFRVD